MLAKEIVWKSSLVTRWLKLGPMVGHRMKLLFEPYFHY